MAEILRRFHLRKNRPVRKHFVRVHGNQVEMFEPGEGARVFSLDSMSEAQLRQVLDNLRETRSDVQQLSDEIVDIPEGARLDVDVDRAYGDPRYQRALNAEHIIESRLRQIEAVRRYDSPRARAERERAQTEYQSIPTGAR